jgi:colanic acid/amylovoran biosynthesis glycosyltransferase
MSRAMGRLVVVTSRFPFGSQESYLRGELAELARHFEEVVVVPVRPPASPAQHALPENARVLAWPLASPELLRRALAAFVARPGRAARALREIAASRDPGRLKNFAVAIKGLALGQWALEHRVEHIHAYWMSTPSTVAFVAALTSGIRWSATAHRWDIYERNAFDVKEQSVSLVRVISERGAADLRTRMPRLNGRVAHVPLGIDIPPFAGRSRESGDFRIACPAALVEVKGHATLLRALSQLRGAGVPVRCTLYGAGPLQAQLERMAATLQLGDCVEFAGFVPQNRLHEEYRAGRFAAIVLASRAAGEKMMEGVPSALLEAMAFGIPVVATDSGSVGEAVDPTTGILVPPDDPDRLAGALFEVFDDPGAARARAEHAYATVSARHDVRAQMRELAAALRGKDGSK